MKYKSWLLKQPNGLRKPLILSDLKNAERVILGYVQRSSFPAVLKVLRHPLSTTSKARKKALRGEGQPLYRLNPQVKDDLLVAGGRPSNAPINENTKHPIILPHKNHVIDLIIQDYHESVVHMGARNGRPGASVFKMGRGGG